MENQNLALKVKQLRSRKGFSQEQLSEESRLSLRTIQRIEKGESVPRGDTLIKLTQALGVTPDDLLEWAEIEDRGYITLLHLGAVSVVLQPVLGIIIPLAMWILKREKIKDVDKAGKKLINFQITWTILLYIFLIVVSKGSYFPFNFNFLDSFFVLFIDFKIGIPILAFYLYNLSFILVNAIRNRKNKDSKYFPAIPFLK